MCRRYRHRRDRPTSQPPEASLRVSQARIEPLAHGVTENVHAVDREEDRGARSEGIPGTLEHVLPGRRHLESHSGVGGWAPMPRKLNPDSRSRTVPKSRLAFTTSDDTWFGRM